MRKQVRMVDLTPIPEGRYTATEVSQIAAVSLRQLQWWDEKRVLSPEIIDHKRLYTPEEVSTARRIGQLRHAGASLAEVRKALRMQYFRVQRIRTPTVIEGTLIIPAPRKH